MLRNIILSIALALVWSKLCFTQEKPLESTGKLSGYMFGDIFYNTRQNDKSKDNINGVQFRRIYFTYDYTISDHFDSRFRLEADQLANTSNGKIGVFVKDAYLRWKNALPGNDFYVGISPTPAFEVSEGFFQYRSLEKTIMDLRGIVSSRDIGIDLKGKVGNNDIVRYWIKVGNNSGNSPETDKHKRLSAHLHFKPRDRVEATVYADYDSRPRILDSFNSISKGNNRVVFAGFVGYKGKEEHSVGLEGFYRTIQHNFRKLPGEALMSQASFGVSANAWVAVGKEVRLVGRYDHFDPNTDLDDDGNSLFIGAVDYQPTENVHVMPNFYIQTYEATGASDDVVGRITFYYIFK